MLLEILGGAHWAEPLVQSHVALLHHFECRGTLGVWAAQQWCPHRASFQHDHRTIERRCRRLLLMRAASKSAGPSEALEQYNRIHKHYGIYFVSLPGTKALQGATHDAAYRHTHTSKEISLLLSKLTILYSFFIRYFETTFINFHTDLTHYYRRKRTMTHRCRLPYATNGLVTATL